MWHPIELSYHILLLYINNYYKEKKIKDNTINKHKSINSYLILLNQDLMNKYKEKIDSILLKH
jgi:hypothetical protein